jgi:D-glycero-D-manno-heptose 1,7-bisphosphate phosphatase
VRVLPGAAGAIRRLKDAGWPVVVVTNQSGIGRGYFTMADYERVSARLEEELASAGAAPLATYLCPHAPDEQPPCGCRKPAGDLFERAARDHGLDLRRSVYIGDRVRDLEYGVGLGGRAYLVGKSGEEPRPVNIRRARTLADAVEDLLGSGPED